jgi:hypothetical protein
VTEIYLLAMAVIFFLASVRVVSDRERMAIFRQSKFIGFRGPGIVITVLMVDRCKKIGIGDTGFMTASDMAEINGVIIPVQTNQSLYATEKITIDGFVDDGGSIKALARKTKG